MPEPQGTMTLRGRATNYGATVKMNGMEKCVGKCRFFWSGGVDVGTDHTDKMSEKPRRLKIPGGKFKRAWMEPGKLFDATDKTTDPVEINTGY